MEQRAVAAAVLAADAAEVVTDRPARTIRILTAHPLVDATWSRYAARERGTNPHIHRHHVDAFYIVEGTLTFRLGPARETVDAPAGTFALVPPHAVHSFDNDSSATVRWLNFHAPSSGFAAYLRGDPSGFDDGEPPADGGRSRDDVILTTAGVAAPQLALEELRLEAGAAIAARREGRGLVAFFVLAGEVAFDIDGGDVAGPRHTWLAAPPGALHGVRNVRAVPARLLTLRAPGLEGVRADRRRPAE